MPPLKYGPGCRFGRLVILSRAGERISCRCDCGTEKIVWATGLLSGDTRSCGCLNRERRKTASRKHGHASNGRHSRVYKAWVSIRQRCLNPSDARYPDYGGRGITMSRVWQASFETFLADLGEPPPGHSLDRLDNDGPYSKENCRWATAREQSRNTRRNCRITWRERTQTLTDWAVELGLTPGKLRARLFTLGWTMDEAAEGHRRVV